MHTNIRDLADLWERGAWTTFPVHAEFSDGTLRVTAVEGSDAWRHTSYGFVHENEHALVYEIKGEQALEVSFLLDYDQQFDQAGLFLRAHKQEWIKAGVEISDGVPQVGAVVTHTYSDWSVAPVPEWIGRRVTMRASRKGDAITLRARVDDEPFRLIRVAWLSPDALLLGGLYCCAPTRAGLTVTFTRAQCGPPDATLHPE